MVGGSGANESLGSSDRDPVSLDRSSSVDSAPRSFERPADPETAAWEYRGGVRGQALIDRVARTDLPVLLQGETGTGKTWLAEAIHRASSRSHAPFVRCPLTDIAVSLVESELFGHVKGAFTGATRDHKGMLAEARGGTIFLDEIGDAPPEVQRKLLTVLDGHGARPVGGDRALPVEVRIIAATLRDLPAMVARGEFREDLYFRIATVTLRLGALNEREDFVDIVHARLAAMAKQSRIGSFSIEREAILRLQRARLAGGVRGLDHLLARALLRADDGRVRAEHIPLAPPVEGCPGLGSLDDCIDRHVRATLALCGGNKTAAALQLEISRNRMIALCKRFRIDCPRVPASAQKPSNGHGPVGRNGPSRPEPPAPGMRFEP